MAEHKTEHFGLNQWALTDPVRVEELNEDNRAIDTALGSIPKIGVYEYTGDGTYGASNPITATFDFKPWIVIIFQKGSSYGVPIMVYGDTGAASNLNNMYESLYLTWGERSVSWYGTKAADRQYNAHNYQYRCIAIGF